MFTFDVRGVKLEHTPFWLDAHRKTPFSFVSHGHSDHLKNHDSILATPPTVLFHAMRAKQKKAIPLEFGQEWELDKAVIRLYPAGHILGSAMIRVEYNGSSLLYTGDFKIRENETCEPIEIPRADILIMESTFGRPEYVNPHSRETLVGEIKDFIDTCLANSITPVVMGYSLGKAQEAMKIIGDMGYNVKVHFSAWRFSKVYYDYGVRFRNCAPWYEKQVAPGEVLIIPPHLMMSRRIKNMPSRYRSVFLSGWANSENGMKFNSHHSIALSDHADFQELLDFIKTVNPSQVYTTHGDKDFPQYIREIGYDARYLEPTKTVLSS